MSVASGRFFLPDLRSTKTTNNDFEIRQDYTPLLILTWRIGMETSTTRTAESLPPNWDVVRLAALLKDRLPRLRRQYGIGTLEIFGSYARNEHRSDSDLDVLVTFTRTPTLFDLVDLQDELGETLGVRVDLVLRSTLREGVARNIHADLLRL